MKTNPRYDLYGILVALAFMPALTMGAESASLVCPDVVSAAAITVASSDWAARPSGNFRLSSAGFSNGPPEKRADLKPASVERKGAQTVETWRFDVEFRDGLWLVCGYGGAAGEITLAKQILPQYATCSVSYKPSSKVGARTINIACR
ncbi:hypothetical protein GJ697_11375 [Pseudoduganella sp. FT25W]|jgi:hypothetical protein|uniref:Uncharacterized protein n=1 Tax=Duganella alba TaxID=2666081 RepID=A0A6L5QFA6_9BURK|nr:STY0301 family protein [Duganella alba]MRX08437.1 hypothetical protein [Duganella alba]MRX17089.1 hypothetical protein [Duganella alba]